MFHKFLQGKFATLFKFVAMSCLAINVLTLLTGIFSRYLLGSSPIWVDEAARYLLIGAVMLIGGIVMLDGEHMRLNIIDKIAPPKLLRIIELYRSCVMICVFGFMTYFSFTYALSIEKFTTIGLGISKTIPMLSLPIGFISLLICSLSGLFQLLSNKKEQV